MPADATLLLTIDTYYAFKFLFSFSRELVHYSTRACHHTEWLSKASFYHHKVLTFHSLTSARFNYYSLKLSYLK